MPFAQVPHTVFPDTLTEIKVMYQQDISTLKQDLLMRTSPGQPCIFDFDCPQVLAAMARGSISQPHLVANKALTQATALHSTVYIPLLYRYYPLGSMGLPGYPKFKEGSRHRNNWTQALWEGYFDTLKCLPEFFLAMTKSIENAFPKRIKRCCPKSLTQDQSCSLYYLKGNIYCNHGYTNNLLATNYLNLVVFKPIVAMSFEENIARLWLGEKDYDRYPYMFVHNTEYLACPNEDSHPPGSVIAIQNGLVCIHGYANAVNWSLFPNRAQTESVVLKVARDTNEMIMPMEKQQVHRTWNSNIQMMPKQDYCEVNSSEQGTMASPLSFSRGATLKNARMTLETEDRGVKVTNGQLQARRLRKIANDAVGIYSQFCRSEAIPDVLYANYILEDSTSCILQWNKDPPLTQKFRSLAAQVVRKLRAKHILALLLEELLKAYHDDPDSPVSQVKLLRFCSEHLMSKKRQKQKVSEVDDCEVQFRDLQLEEPTGTKEDITGDDRTDRLNVAKATTVDDGISDIENHIRKLKQLGTETDDTSMSDEYDELSKPPKCSPECRFCRQEQEARQAKEKEKEEKNGKGYDSDNDNKGAAMFIDGTHDNDGDSDTDIAAIPHSRKWTTEEESHQSCCLHGVQNPIRLGSFEAYCYAKQPRQACNSWERLAAHYTQTILTELKESILPRPVLTTITEADTVVWSATSFTIETILNFIRSVMKSGTTSNDGLGTSSNQCAHGHIKLQRKPNGHFVACEATQPVSECGIVSGYLHELSEWGNILAEVDFASSEVHMGYEEEIISSPDLIDLNQVQDEESKETFPKPEYKDEKHKQDMDAVIDHPESTSCSTMDGLEISCYSDTVSQQQFVEDMNHGNSGINIDRAVILVADSSIDTVNAVTCMEADGIKVPDSTATNKSVDERDESSAAQEVDIDTNDTIASNASNKDIYRCYRTGSHISAFDDPCYDGKIDTTKCIHGNRAIITHFPWHARCQGKTEKQWCPINTLRNQLSLSDTEAVYEETIEAVTKWCPPDKKNPYLCNGQELTCNATNYLEAYNKDTDSISSVYTEWQGGNHCLKRKHLSHDVLEATASAMPPLKRLCIHNNIRKDFRRGTLMECVASNAKSWCVTQNDTCVHGLHNPHLHREDTTICTALCKESPCNIMQLRAGVEFKATKDCGITVKKRPDFLPLPRKQWSHAYRMTTRRRAIADKLMKAHNNVATLTALGYNYTIRVPVNSLQSVLKTGYQCIHGANGPNIRNDDTIVFCTATTQHQLCSLIHRRCAHGYLNPLRSSTRITYCYAPRYPLYIAVRSQPPCPIDCKLRHCTRRVQMRPHASTCHYRSRKQAGRYHLVPSYKPWW